MQANSKANLCVEDGDKPTEEPETHLISTLLYTGYLRERRREQYAAKLKLPRLTDLGHGLIKIRRQPVVGHSEIH